MVAELDVDDDASVARFFATPVAVSEPIDSLIHNVGIYSINDVEHETVASLQAIMNTNFFGEVTCMKAVVPAMRGRVSRLIINISSTDAWLRLRPAPNRTGRIPPSSSRLLLAMH